MRRCILVLSIAAALSTTGLAQDAGMGTPVITPPILNQPSEAQQQLLVPPTQVNPAPLAPPAPEPSAPPTQQSEPAGQGAAPPSAAAPNAPEPAEPKQEDVERTLATETFNQWTLECFEPAFNDAACQIVHRVTAGDASQVVMVFALAAKSDEDAAAIQMALPLGISLPAGIRLVIGEGYQNQIALQRCTPQGCIVEGIGSNELLAAMKREANGAVVVENEQGQQVQLPFSLNGFTAAYAAMVERGS
jgi:invasion protein IalB